MEWNDTGALTIAVEPHRVQNDRPQASAGSIVLAARSVAHLERDDTGEIIEEPHMLEPHCVGEYDSLNLDAFRCGRCSSKYALLFKAYTPLKLIPFQRSSSSRRPCGTARRRYDLSQTAGEIFQLPQEDEGASPGVSTTRSGRATPSIALVDLRIRGAGRGVIASVFLHTSLLGHYPPVPVPFAVGLRLLAHRHGPSCDVVVAVG
ncbi:hypothetical protein C8J57DRAFT_1737337 [Mycena rebaudengoi]|nr:hypothetical protein C8J57DRAFT_1737337 [Mycena rebaudengoi]